MKALEADLLTNMYTSKVIIFLPLPDREGTNEFSLQTQKSLHKVITYGLDRKVQCWVLLWCKIFSSSKEIQRCWCDTLNVFLSCNTGTFIKLSKLCYVQRCKFMWGNVFPIRLCPMKAKLTLSQICKCYFYAELFLNAYKIKTVIKQKLLIHMPILV